MHAALFIAVCLFASMTAITALTALRYGDARFFVLRAIATRNGHRMHIARDVNEAKRALADSATKGVYVEHLLARRAWLPILSIESEDGDTHAALRTRLHTVLAAAGDAPPEPVFDARVRAQFTTTPVADSRVVSLAAADALLTWALGEYDRDVLDCIYDASVEWRKQLALKGVGCADTKTRAVRAVRDILAMSRLAEHADDFYMQCIVLQTFAVSPMINFADIMATYDTNIGIDENIQANHPFPVLERFIEPDTQVFIPTDTLCVLPFGYGPRQCPGKALAHKIVRAIVREAQAHANWKPQSGHRYSGRTNDSDVSLESATYICRVLWDIFWNTPVKN